MNKRLPVYLLIFLSTVSAHASEALILELFGQVSIVVENDTRPARKGDSLLPGQGVITGPDGTALILLSDGSRIDLMSNSHIIVKEQEGGTGDNLLGRLWGKISGKFSDTERAAAHAGSVGTVRSGPKEETLRDFNLSDEDEKNLAEILGQMDDEELPPESIELIKALILEDFRQSRRAEIQYLLILENNPDDEIVMEMLIDLYLKNRAPGKANEMAERKMAIAGSE